MIALITAAVLSLPNPLPANSVPACEYEDGSGQKVCIWDGKTMGNERGRSVIIRNGGTDQHHIRFISHRNAMRLLK